MISKEGYLTALGVGGLDIAESLADEHFTTKVKGVDVALADQTVNILNIGRIVEAVGSNVGAYMMRNKAETAGKRVVETVALTTIPLAIRSIVNILRREVITPHKSAMRGRGDGYFQTDETDTQNQSIRSQNQSVRSAGGRRFSGFT